VNAYENPAPLETVLRDVQSGGVLVQDLSGRDTFRFAHKSYMEYLVSAFFSGFILQDKKDHLFLMKVNAITSAMGFKPSQLTPSPDVERFIAEQISSQVELEDKQGHPLPIRGNEQQYAKKLFQILTNHRIYYWFPNIAMWLTFNTYLKHFAIIGVLSVLSICSYSLLYINIKFFLSILCVLFFFWAFYYYKSFNLNTEQANSLYHRIMRIYIHICLLLSINIEYISKNSISILEKNKIYFGRNISVIFASICYITFILAANLIGPDLGKIDIILSFASLLVSYIPLASIIFLISYSPLYIIPFFVTTSFGTGYMISLIPILTNIFFFTSFLVMTIVSTMAYNNLLISQDYVYIINVSTIVIIMIIAHSMFTSMTSNLLSTDLFSSIVNRRKVL
jgi:hypothetical protein